MPNDRLPRKLLVSQVKGSRPSGRFGLNYNVASTVINAALLGHTGMLRTDCFGETRLVLHVPHSS